MSVCWCGEVMMLTFFHWNGYHHISTGILFEGHIYQLWVVSELVNYYPYSYYIVGDTHNIDRLVDWKSSFSGRVRIMYSSPSVDYSQFT